MRSYECQAEEHGRSTTEDTGAAAGETARRRSAAQCHDVEPIRDQLSQQGKISDFALMLGILDTALHFMHRNWHRIRIENPTDDGQ